MKKVIAILLVLVLSCIALVACGQSEKKAEGTSETAAKETAASANPIVGSWTYEGGGGYTYVFKDDGTGEYLGRTFTYTTEGNKLSILYDGDTTPFETEFEINGNKLNVIDSLGSDTIYIKQ